MAVLWAATILSTLVAVFSLFLTVALARRLRTLVSHVYRFLPITEGDGLPSPGTPLPDFSVAAESGEQITRESFAGPQRLLVFLTTTCSSCTDQVPLIQQLRLPERPVVVVVGDEQQRPAMAAQLADVAEVVPEDDEGPLAVALEVREFPAVMVIGRGVVTVASHDVTTALARLKTPAGV
jgi:hypothetical protein